MNDAGKVVDDVDRLPVLGCWFEPPLPDCLDNIRSHWIIRTLNDLHISNDAPLCDHGFEQNHSHHAPLARMIFRVHPPQENRSRHVTANAKGLVVHGRL